MRTVNADILIESADLGHSVVLELDGKEIERIGPFDDKDIAVLYAMQMKKVALSIDGIRERTASDAQT